MTQGFALYRLPYAQKCTLLSGAVSQWPACTALSHQSGFVVAPFAASPERPVLLIAPDQTTSFPTASDVTCPLQSPTDSGLTATTKDGRANYHIDFANFHAHLLNNDFQKLVLSRSILLESIENVSPLTLFQRACEHYPRMFVALVYTPQSGMWLTSTPEILLSGCDGRWQTMALAGTMPYADDVRWSDKNIQEQRYVATYIAHQLELFTNDFREEGPYTARAGHLVHLRSDFRFSLPADAPVGDLLRALHPTPAVCGLPKHESFRFILQNEHHDRSYYSGFMGPLAVGTQTHLFVTLRCMQIFRDAFRLYAGGGLLKDSIEEQEWQETETKLDTMRLCIVTKKTSTY